MLNAYELPGPDMLCFLFFFNTASGGMSWNDIHHELRNERGVSGANWMNWEKYPIQEVNTIRWQVHVRLW